MKATSDISAESINLKDIAFDPENANKGTERGLYMLEHSMEEFGFIEAGTLDKNNVLIGGNKRTEASQSVGISEDAIVVDVDGTRPVYIRCKHLDLNTEQGRRAAYALNRVAQVSIDFDPLQIAEDLSSGLDISDMWFPEELDSLINSASAGGDMKPPSDQERGEEANRQSGAYRSLRINFASEEDVNEFAAVTGIDITQDTKLAWFPSQ